MKKLLSVLVVILFLLTMVSFVLGHLLYQKREILKGRTQKLQATVIMLAAMIEDNSPAAFHAWPSYPARDIDSTTAEVIEDPDRSDFWHSYRHNLEPTYRTTLDLRSDLAQLMQYYQVDRITLKPLRDPLTGVRLTSGPGTMQEVLDYTLAKARSQWELLNQTRVELSKIRVELVATITDLNIRKHDLRLAKSTVVARNETITSLQNTVEQRDQKIKVCQTTIVDLEDEMDEVKNDNLQQEEKIAQIEQQNKQLTRELEIALLGGGVKPDRKWASFTPGHKGSVTAVNTNWNFVTFSLSDGFMKQYTKARTLSQAEPAPALMIMRGVGNTAEFVTKVKLCRVDPATCTGIADVLKDWKQMNVRPGDTVVY